MSENCKFSDMTSTWWVVKMSLSQFYVRTGNQSCSVHLYAVCKTQKKVVQKLKIRAKSQRAENPFKTQKSC